VDELNLTTGTQVMCLSEVSLGACRGRRRRSGVSADLAVMGRTSPDAGAAGASACWAAVVFGEPASGKRFDSVAQVHDEISGVDRILLPGDVPVPWT